MISVHLSSGLFPPSYQFCYLALPAIVGVFFTSKISICFFIVPFSQLKTTTLLFISRVFTFTSRTMVITADLHLNLIIPTPEPSKYCDLLISFTLRIGYVCLLLLYVAFWIVYAYVEYYSSKLWILFKFSRKGCLFLFCFNKA